MASISYGLQNYACLLRGANGSSDYLAFAVNPNRCFEVLNGCFPAIQISMS